MAFMLDGGAGKWCRMLCSILLTTTSGFAAAKVSTLPESNAQEALVQVESDDTTSVAVNGTGPGDWGPGDYPAGIGQQTYLTITGVPGQQGLTRKYKVHVPRGYDRNVPAPALFCLHGLQQNPVMFCVNGTGLPAKSDAEGFVLIMPFGHGNSWNGGDCCGTAQSMGLDDVGLMRAIFAEVGRHVNLDLGRVYTTGLSNGGYLSYKLACEAADLFVAAAPGSAAAPKSCNPSQPISILDVHGTADTYVPYEVQKPSLETLATANGCQVTTKASTILKSGGDTTCVNYDGCPAGVFVNGCTINGGGHVWFGDPSCGTGVGALGCIFVGANSNFMVNTDAAWSFFKPLSR